MYNCLQMIHLVVWSIYIIIIIANELPLFVTGPSKVIEQYNLYLPPYPIPSPLTHLPFYTCHLSAQKLTT